MEREPAVDIVIDDRPSPVDALADGGNRYAFLIQRAVAFVRTSGGLVHEAALVAHVFGSGSSPTLWQPLLRQVLTDSAEVELRPDGYWTLVDAPAAPDAPVLAEFVALDVETTGLRPLHQRIIELAAIRYREGVEVERYETLCHPEKRIPRYIVELTGIADLHVADAPRFAEVADRVVEFVGGSLIVGHNVGFDISFVNAELKRLGRPHLINDSLDVMPLAMKLLATVRRPSLDKVALALGLNPCRIHRAAVDAELTAEAALRLAERAREAGHNTPDRLRALAAPMTRRPKDGVGRGRAVLDRSLLADVPRKPGVYIMRDAYDHVIYVGKSKNLRDRVSSYYSQPLGYTRKMDGLLESMARIEVEVTGSELEALLLESQLIKRYQPRYNTALRSFEQYPFIRVDVANPWPRVTLVKERKDDGARYFGPFRSQSTARKAVDLINASVPLRTCPRSFKNARSYGSPCLQLDLGRCLGPCVGRADREVYRGLVTEVVRFLDGEDEVLIGRLWAELEAAAERLDFERARRLRNDLRSVEHVVAAQRQLREAIDAHNLILVLPSAVPDSREVLLVVRGRLWAQLRAARDDPADLAQRLEAAWARAVDDGVRPVEHDSLDETNLLNRWLFRHTGHPAILPLDSPPATQDWTNSVCRVLSLSDTDLVFARVPTLGEELEAGDDWTDGLVVSERPSGSTDSPMHVGTAVAMESSPSGATVGAV